ncbi:C-X-C motif chemokine 6-like isoform X2 [Nycticebus coucang]|uniref:C-X-C motif chemokine 6-like isoform X2 n=1 Tax=Nycticebus coucang TaxID=9470 RepID=UPI00234CD4AA|nr:C-X-C motif chemokine 6-like isoform X2 [Nycticebus coucang]
MQVLHSGVARVRGPSGSLCALTALLLLLTPPRPLASAGPVAAVVQELRCMCLNPSLGRVHPKNIIGVQVIAAGPQCPKVEVIATLKNGKELCLDPEAPLIQKFIQMYLNSGKKKN